MQKFVCIFAHPDDESFATGGTIAELATQYEVSLICCTDGNHQDKNLKEIRAAELCNACEVLRIKQLYHLDFEDGNLSNSNYHLLASKIKDILDQNQPETVITFHPNGVSGHIDHIVVTSVVNYLFYRLDYLREVWYYTSVGNGMVSNQDYFVYRPETILLSSVNKVVETTHYFKTKI